MKRMGVLEWVIVLAITAIILAWIHDKVIARPTESEINYIPMECTAYCMGTIRCDGGPARKGICAGASRYYGKTALIYENNGGKPGEFLGYYEVLDTGGDYRIQNGTCLDVYLPTEWECIQWGRKNVLVIMVDGKG